MTQVMLTPAEAAEYLRISEQRLARLRLDGRGSPYLRIGRNIRYRREDLDNWLQSTVRISTSDIPAHEAAAA